MLPRILLVLIACSFSFQARAMATLTEWGSLTSISQASCSTDFCGADADLPLFLSTLSVDPIDDGAGETSASVSTGTWPAAGSASANAVVSGGLSIPSLTAGASADVNSWIAGQSLVAQGYTYNGSGETISLDFSLTGNITNPDNDTITGLVAFVGFFTPSTFSFPTDLTDPLTTYTMLLGLPSLASDSETIEITTTGGVAQTGSVSITVNPDDEFYLVMGLMAGAGGSGAIAESLSTLVADFSGDPALTPAFAAVPLPSSAMLLLSALAFIASRRKVIY